VFEPNRVVFLVATLFQCSFMALYPLLTRLTANVLEGVIKGVTRAFFERPAPQTPQLGRASVRRREENYCRGVYCP